MSFHEILTELATITGHPRPRIRLPHNLVLPMAYLAEAWARLAGNCEPLLTVDGVRMAKKRMFYSTEKAKTKLGFKTRPVSEALRDAVDWFRQNGYLR